MFNTTWKSIKSPIMQEMRVALKKKAGKGEAPISNKEANRTWREDILGIFSEDQKKEAKSKRQEKTKRNKRSKSYSSEE
jgi:hypothetical protein